MPGSGTGGPIDPYGLGNVAGGGASGFWGNVFGGIAETVGAGAGAGFGLGDAASGMDGDEGTDVSTGLLDKIGQGAVDIVASQYPGYGTLWTYDTRDGVGITSAGWVAAAVAAAGVWWLLK